MSIELEMLAWVSGMTVMMWVPYILAHIGNVGLVPALTYQADGTPLPGWAARAKRAHCNAVENLAPFAALVIVAHLAEATNGATAAAAITFFWARIAHLVLHYAGIPFLRSFAFVVGWLSLVCIFYQIVT